MSCRNNFRLSIKRKAAANRRLEAAKAEITKETLMDNEQTTPLPKKAPEEDPFFRYTRV